MNNEEKILSLLEKMYIDFNKRFGNLETKLGSIDTKVGNLETKVGKLETRLDRLDARLGNLEIEMVSIKASASRIETDHGEKLRALFDGHELITEKLDIIEQEVSKHEEIILRGVR
ncbi:conserved hypothetical protein [anaerobic digester metagenome]|jgi:chromosome segregation ATPase|uniref:Chromosome partition protein Smc n=1 Tax=anaerobic digester metagenome TaxID=1263854 RepID=A0A485M587_9ZZZZ